MFQYFKWRGSLNLFYASDNISKWIGCCDSDYSGDKETRDIFMFAGELPSWWKLESS